MLFAERLYSKNQFQQEARKLKRNYKESFQNNKYKTEICKNWIAGQCKFGQHCIFAHGTEEKKIVIIQKTQPCISFTKEHYCSYGDKCQYKHDQGIKKRLPIFVAILAGNNEGYNN
ncbi:hypothetical protein SteCoe_32125 [Stentor coeruleus]|uniref:C3H1-type domain-containing protein n=1 Tax=Stentor coeruleus TaxID=5963 RepID=A0A1R2AZQ6_9CILI|nr:hypothetical protein SteCoe_32125 [Stentor coeruleus]